jgi:ADP-L-glycero-D-manno-heptose 6-epimerase
MILVTGGAGFIGSCLVAELNHLGFNDVVVSDALGHGEKWQNLVRTNFTAFLPKNSSVEWLRLNAKKVETIFHMGACSTTTETNADYLMTNNFQMSCDLFSIAAENNIPFIYASSAATYGDGSKGFSDKPLTVAQLQPINKYGFSKQIFDKWVLTQKAVPSFWTGFKFFNVYGPNEYHKGGQASVVYHAYPQVLNSGRLKLFKSYKKEFADGEQKRDFIYVRDVVNVMIHAWKSRREARSGIYNLGTGEARTFVDLGKAVFKSLGKTPAIDFIEMPDNVKNQYQYFTQADTALLRSDLKWNGSFTSLEDGVSEYVLKYLNAADRFYSSK